MHRLIQVTAFLLPGIYGFPQSPAKKDFTVIAYYAGNTTLIDSFAVEKLTHLIFCFCHLKGNRLNINNARYTATIQKMVALKSRASGSALEWLK